MRQIDYDAVFDANTKARKAFDEAQLAVARVKVRDLAELSQSLYYLCVRRCEAAPSCARQAFDQYWSGNGSRRHGYQRYRVI